MSGDITELRQAKRVVNEETGGWTVNVDVYRKDWPASDLIFVKISRDDVEEYVLIGPGSSEAAVRKCLQVTARRVWNQWEEKKYGRRSPYLP